MKNALLLPIRYIAILLICVALFIMAQMGIDFHASLSWGERASLYLYKLLNALPSIILLTLFLTSFIPFRHKSNLWISLLTLFLLTAGGLFLSTAFYQNPSGTEQGSNVDERNKALRNQYGINKISENKSSLRVNSNFSLQADFSSSDGRLLSIATEKSGNEDQTTSPLSAPSLLERMEQGLSTMFISPQDIFVSRSSLLRKAITCLAFAFFLCSTIVFLKITDWKLFNALLFFFAFWGGVSLAGIVFDGGFSSIVASFLPHKLSAYVSDGIIGVIGLCLFLFSVFFSLSKTARGEK